MYAQVPESDAASLDTVIRDIRGRNVFAGPLGVLAFDPAIHRYALVDRWGKSDDMPAWSEEPNLEEASELKALSHRVGGVVAFYEVDEGLTTGVYGAFRDGELVRALEWADDQWMRVEGDPQVWEKALFGAESLARALEAAAEAGQDQDLVRACFNTGVIEAGAAWPVPDRMAVHIRTALAGPPHGFEPWPRRKELVKSNQAKDGAA